MTRLELADLIGRELAYAAAAARARRPVHPDRIRNRILDAADDYATHVGGITAERRAAIGNAVADTSAGGLVHYQPEGAKSIACGADGFGLRRTDEPGAVDCRKCQRTGLWKQAAA